MHPYARAVLHRLEEAVASQDEVLHQAGEVIAQRVRDGGVVHVFGSGHSQILAEELFTRAGGPTFVSPVFDPALAVPTGHGRSTHAERLHGYAEVALRSVDLRSEDVLVVVSNSGRNPVPVEAALHARARGCYTIAITSVDHSSRVTSRHESGQKLMDVADLVLDSHAAVGDAELTTPDGRETYGPSSTILISTLAHTVMCIAVESLMRTGHEPPILRSANLDGVEEANRERKLRYAQRIPLLVARQATDNLDGTDR